MIDLELNEVKKILEQNFDKGLSEGKTNIILGMMTMGSLKIKLILRAFQCKIKIRWPKLFLCKIPVREAGHKK